MTERLTAASEQLIRDWDQYPDAIDANELSARLWIIEREARAAALPESADEGLREAAQALVDATEDGRIWAVLMDDGSSGVRLFVPDALIDEMRNTRNTLRAALAATQPATGGEGS